LTGNDGIKNRALGAQERKRLDRSSLHAVQTIAQRAVIDDRDFAIGLLAIR
jgi:hypothetical protein